MAPLLGGVITCLRSDVPPPQKKVNAPNVIMKLEKEMGPKEVKIEDWDGDGAIRIPDEALQELGVDVGNTLYLIATSPPI